MLLLARPASRQASVVGFVEIKDIVASRTPSSPEISMPAQVQIRPEQQREPTIESPDPAAKMDPAQTANAAPDFLDTPLGRGMANGFFSTLGEGITLRDDIRGYYFELLERINDRWWQKAVTLKDSARRDGIAEILIGRDGTLHGVRLITDTGSWEVDRSIIDVLSGASPLPRFPASYEPEFFQAPIKFTAPSNFFGSKGLR